MRPELLKGHMDLLLLAVVGEEPGHGYAIIERIKQRSDAALSLAEGSVYPALYRLERDGLLTSSVATAAGRPRRTYRLTAAGQEAMAERRREWRTFAGAISAVIGGQS